MRPFNLLPPESKSTGAPLRAGALAYVVVALLALAVVAVTALVMIGNDINADKTELASLESQADAAAERVAVLAPYTQMATLSQTRETTVANLAESRFDWQRVLNELAIVIPSDVWLTGISAAVSPEVASAGDAASSGIAGPSLSFTGCGASQESVARFVAALNDIDGVTRVGLSQSSLPDPSGGGAADEESTGDEASDATSTDCQTKSFIAGFTAIASFDAVTVQAPAPTTPAEPASSETASDDGGVAETKAEQQESVSSTERNIEKADNISQAVGVG